MKTEKNTYEGIISQQRLIGIRKVLPTADSGDDFFWFVMNALPGGNNSSYRIYRFSNYYLASMEVA